MKNTIITIILITKYSLVKYGYAQCGIDKFKCKDGQCIANELLCDGQANCKDESDETYIECNKPEMATCPDYTFRCSYGACIDGDAICNGIKNCIDNSDETLPNCINSSFNTSTSCAKNQFKCNNRQCIAESNLCDGIADCTDNSDETIIQCSSINCPKFFFRCDYGACIDGDLKCNGIKNCADGSDEYPRHCKEIEATTPRLIPITLTTSQSPVTIKSKSCLVPPQPINGYWKLHKSQCCTEQDGYQCENCNVKQGTWLESGAYLVYTCNSGYKLNNSGIAFCSRGEWLSIPACIEIRCAKLQSPSMFAICKHDDLPVSCFDSVLPRTTAQLTCSPGYREDTRLTSSSNVRCNNNGQWEPEPIQCIPACGISTPSSKTLIVNGTQPQITEFPWHASLYVTKNSSASKQFICGATIIHESLLITAAHCVYDDDNKKFYDASKYDIITGNIFREYDNPLHDIKIVKKAKVKNIYNVCSYLGFDGNYAADIAILEITEPLIFSSFLVPICLDILDEISLHAGILGKVAGFGRTASSPSSQILQTIKLPIVSEDQCTSSTNDSRKYIAAYDKFCAGYANGSSVCDGDSGGGLIFEKRGQWYLKGIVSLSVGIKIVGGSRICDSYSYSLFTDLDRHMTWIQDIIVKLETHKTIPLCIERYNTKYRYNT